eukprot:TRINITY_DN7146_c0_g1_i5.p1 TRINITY_DN7146_c0_g1~~TRINITY_DN7146_c0_g1_i5.p1  ORF type:complete len:350 (+),score=93.81 TRINITY_DN7146_c0_g1_i5:1429-2478(+)
MVAERHAAELIAEEERRQGKSETSKKKRRRRKRSSGSKEDETLHQEFALDLSLEQQDVQGVRGLEHPQPLGHEEAGDKVWGAMVREQSRAKSPGKVLDHPREHNPECILEGETPPSSPKQLDRDPELVAELNQLRLELRDCQAGRNEAEYQMEHQQLWFGAAQQEAEGAREAEAIAYKRLEEYRHESDEVVRGLREKIAGLEARLGEELECNEKLHRELQTLRQAGCENGELVQSEGLLQAVEEMTVYTTARLDRCTRAHEQAVSWLQHRLSRHLQALETARHIKAQRMDYDHDQRLCVVCEVEPKTHIFTKCFHKCVCQTCADMIKTSDNGRCPLCRQMSTDIHLVFE